MKDKKITLFSFFIIGLLASSFIIPIGAQTRATDIILSNNFPPMGPNTYTVIIYPLQGYPGYFTCSFLGDGSTITSVQFWLKADFTLDFDLYAVIRNATGTFGVNDFPDKVLTTSQTVSSYSISSTYTQITFNFNTPLVTELNKIYFIGIEHTYVMDQQNLFVASTTGRLINSNGGRTMQSTALGSWIKQSQDISYVILGTQGAIPPTPTPSPTPTPTPSPTPTPDITANSTFPDSAITDWYQINTNDPYSVYPSGYSAPFTGDGSYLDHAQFRVRAQRNADSGDVLFASGLYLADSNGLPTGDSLAVSDFVHFTAIPPNTYVTVTFNFANSVVMREGIQYCITIRCSSPGLGGVTGVAPYLQLGYTNNMAYGPPANVFKNGAWQQASPYPRAIWFTVFGSSYSPPPIGDGLIDGIVFPDTGIGISISPFDVTTSKIAIGAGFKGNGDYLFQVRFRAWHSGVTSADNPEYICTIYSFTGTWGVNALPSGPPLAQSVTRVRLNSIPSNINFITFTFNETWQTQPNTFYFVVFEPIYESQNAIGQFNTITFSSTTDLAVVNNGRTVTFNTVNWVIENSWIYFEIIGSQMHTTPPPPTNNPSGNVPNPSFAMSINTDGLWQSLLAWDFMGFIFGAWTFSLGGVFWYILALIVSIGYYIRYNNLNVLIVIWFILGGVFTALIPLVGPLGLTFFVFGFAGLLYKAIAEPKS